jgi:hypothetical protein
VVSYENRHNPHVFVSAIRLVPSRQVRPGLQADAEDPTQRQVQAGHHRQQHAPAQVYHIYLEVTSPGSREIYLLWIQCGSSVISAEN